MPTLARTDPRTAPTVDELATRVARVADRTELASLRQPAATPPSVPSAGPATSTSSAGEAGPLRFRGATYDAAVQAAEDALGARPHVLAAHRIRRGGIGGFFATDLGVEVQVEVPGETVDQAVERLVESGHDADRAAWIRELARAAGIELPDVPEPSDVDAPAQPQAAAVAAVSPSDDEYLDDVVFERPARPTTPPLAATEVPEIPEIPVVSTPTTPEAVSSTPTRRQVDLAVVAASEMIRLTGDQAPGTTVSIQVTVSTADGRSVSAEARIESPTPKPARRTTTRNETAR